MRDYLSFSILPLREHLELFVISHIFWWLLYAFIHIFIHIKHKNIKDVYDTKNRIVSIIHGLFCIYISFYDVFVNKTDKCGNDNSNFQNNSLIISCSYFLYDAIACLIFGISNVPMFIHHFVCVLGFYFGIIYNNSATEMIRGLLVAEVTNPIMHLREIFKNYGLGKTKTYLLLDIIYMIMYMFSRLGYGAMVTHFTLFCDKGNLIFAKITGLVVWLQSIYFSYRMIRIIRFRCDEYQERKKKNVKLFWLEHNKQLDELTIYKKKKAAVYVP